MALTHELENAKCNNDTAREVLHGLIVKHFNKTNTDEGGEHDDDKPPMVSGFKAQLFKQGGQVVHGVPTVEIKDPIASFYTRDLVEKQTILAVINPQDGSISLQAIPVNHYGKYISWSTTVENMDPKDIIWGSK
ncbi:hypothetical protein L228DRAFT_278168 [Xylona heveae TC161]|uniref:Uncharacterized protein n=1 Tax=Xylona heveae (strain CBS 132557 / TC161) TaxID=1328760 RepID=A0A165GAA8_XYLHT|nr:hypothetical protein L228DRAFT_278168 [Xylona heveae TC161]KZF21945.1 hypothetical protein L228DRAFT_278168 [Xylona heveae TC161]